MTQSALLALVMPPMVQAKPAVGRINPDSQSRHQREEQKQEKGTGGQRHETSGEPSKGRLIDTMA